MCGISIMACPKKCRAEENLRYPDRREGGGGFPKIVKIAGSSLPRFLRDPFNNLTARGKTAFLPKRPQFAETFRLLGKGVNVRDFYNTKPLNIAHRGENAVPTDGRAAVSPQNHGIPQRLCARNA